MHALIRKPLAVALGLSLGLLTGAPATQAANHREAPITALDHKADIADWFEQYYSIRFRNYPVSDAYLHEAEQVACG